MTHESRVSKQSNGFSESICVNLDCGKMTEKLYLCIATGTFYCTNAKYTNAVSQIAS